MGLRGIRGDGRGNIGIEGVHSRRDVTVKFVEITGVFEIRII